MADKISKKAQIFKNVIPTDYIGMEIDKWVTNYQMMRKSFERRWYDNNFFDDGYHYRYVSRTTGRIVDLTQQGDLFIPKRAIPKASRQIRGVSNLLLSGEYVPVVYPEKITKVNYPDPQMFQMALQVAKDNAKKVGSWVKRTWDDLEFDIQLILMVLLTTKHGVSFLEIWPDPVEEAIKTKVFDAFDIYLPGNLTSIYDAPHIIKSVPTYISEIKANENFKEEQVMKLSPDNKYASSEIKQAYMTARFGNQEINESSVTLLQKEAFIKEYLNDDNWSQAVSQADESGAMEGKSKGDMILRQTFSSAGVTLRDKYVNLPDYPFVDYRMEPGPIYQVPLIERFIPANKSLDSVISRLERYIGTMITGTWLKRRGENMEITNIAGGQVLEYDTVPPVQANMSSVPAVVQWFIGEINSIIEEQGSTTSALGQTQPGVKSGVAIESLKASEYANLKIPTKMLKNTVKRIAEKMMDIAATHFIQPQTVYLLDQGNPSYFDIIGEKGMQKYRELAKGKGSTVSVPEAIEIKKDYKVDIEIESGLGFTEEGKRATMIQIITFIKDLAKEGYITPAAVALVVNRFLEIFQFGSLQEFMEAMDEGTPPITNKQITEMKVALMEVISDLQKATMSKQGQMPQQGASATPETAPASTEDEDIKKVKVGFMEALADLKRAGGGQNAVNQTG